MDNKEGNNITTRADFEAEVTTRLMAAANSTLFPPTRITEIVKQSHFWATGLYFWRELNSAKTTTTTPGQNYYDFPTMFKPDSIMQLFISGQAYKRVAFDDFMDYQANNTSSQKQLFANWGRQFFINPTPTASLTMDVYGNKQADDLTSSTSTTIFSMSNDQGNEAIVKKSISVALKRLDPAVAGSEEQGAIQLLQVIWDKQQKANQRDQRLDHPFFDVPNMFGTSAVSNIGSFSIDLNN